MEFMLERTIAAVIALIGPLLTLFDLPGNSLMLLTAVFYAIYDQALYFNVRLLSAMLIIYAVGEGWEFFVSLFGIKRKDVSWIAVFFIAVGGFCGTLVGTAALPVLGSFLGGIAGAFMMAFVYELLHTGVTANAFNLAWQAAKVRCLAMLGKITAGIVLAVLLVKLVIFL